MEPKPPPPFFSLMFFADSFYLLLDRVTAAKAPMEMTLDLPRLGLRGTRGAMSLTAAQTRRTFS